MRLKFVFGVMKQDLKTNMFIYFVFFPCKGYLLHIVIINVVIPHHLKNPVYIKMCFYCYCLALSNSEMIHNYFCELQQVQHPPAVVLASIMKADTIILGG